MHRWWRNPLWFYPKNLTTHAQTDRHTHTYTVSERPHWHSCNHYSQKGVDGWGWEVGGTEPRRLMWTESQRELRLWQISQAINPGPASLGQAFCMRFASDLLLICTSKQFPPATSRPLWLLLVILCCLPLICHLGLASSTEAQRTVQLWQLRTLSQHWEQEASKNTPALFSRGNI